MDTNTNQTPITPAILRLAAELINNRLEWYCCIAVGVALSRINDIPYRIARQHSDALLLPELKKRGIYDCGSWKEGLSEEQKKAERLQFLEELAQQLEQS